MSQLQRAAFLHPSLSGPRDRKVRQLAARGLRRSGLVGPIPNPIIGPTANPWSLGKRGPEERGVRGADATPRPRLLGPQSALCAPRTRPLPRAAWRRPPGLARAGADRPPPALWLEARSRSLQPARETRSRPARLGPAAVPYLPRLCSQPARPACLRRLPARRRGAPARWAASHVF